MPLLAVKSALLVAAGHGMELDSHRAGRRGREREHEVGMRAAVPPVLSKANSIGFR